MWSGFPSGSFGRKLQQAGLGETTSLKTTSLKNEFVKNSFANNRLVKNGFANNSFANNGFGGRSIEANRFAHAVVIRSWRCRCTAAVGRLFRIGSPFRFLIGPC